MHSQLFNQQTSSFQIPGSRSEVVVSSPVLLSSSTARLTSITIVDGGRIVFDPQGQGQIYADRIFVQDGGFLEMGSADCLFEGSAEIVLTGEGKGQ